MDLRQGIIETANAMGMEPHVLATIISYETGGTFDPLKKGPTTQWGQHEGLIQFGQPQQKQYGVDLSSYEAAIASQLGADGAIVKYFRQNGWKPGMSELDAYSIVNAGAPGRYNATDANNGGAKGTVKDKVETQFAGHRTNASKLLGGDYVPETQYVNTAPADTTPAGTTPTENTQTASAEETKPDYSYKPTFMDVNMFNAPVRRQRRNMLGEIFNG